MVNNVNNESELCQLILSFFILGGEELGWPGSGKGGMVTERLRNTGLSLMNNLPTPSNQLSNIEINNGEVLKYYHLWIYPSHLDVTT